MLAEPFNTLLTGAIAAAVIGIIGALIGAWLQGRREHRRWVREQKHDAYREFLRYVERMQPAHSEKSGEDQGAYVDRVTEALGSLRLVGPDDIARDAEKFASVAYDLAFVKSGVEELMLRKYRIDRESLIASMRKELRIKV